MINIDDNFIEEVKEKNDILEVVSSYVDLKGSHENHKGLCPFHNEKTPSFMVNEKKQIFKCFGCGEGGDVISFIMKKENMDFMEALRFLADRANIPWPQESISEEYKRNVQKKAELIDIHTEAARFYFSKLWTDCDDSLTYLKKRGLKDKIIKNFGLGYAPADHSLLKYLSKKKYSEEILLESGIFVEKKGKIRERFFSRIMFPIFDIRGRVIAFGGRVLNDKSFPKYLNSPETMIFHKKENLYGLHIAKQNAKFGFVLVEGYMDAISLHEQGFPFAVASLGTALSKEQGEKLKKYSGRIYLAYDSDEAGKAAILRAIDILKEQKISPYIIDLGEFKDPDESIRKEGTNGFQIRIDNAKPAIQFINDCIKSKYDLSTDKDQLEFTKEITSTLKRHKNAVEVEKEIIRISNLTGISIKALGTEIYGDYFSPKQFKTTVSSQNSLSNFQRENIPLNAKDFIETEMRILHSIWSVNEYRDLALEYLEEDYFSSPETKELFSKILNGTMQETVEEQIFQGSNIEYKIISKEQLIAMIKMIRKKNIQDQILSLQEIQKRIDISNVDNHKRLIEIGIKITELNKEIKNL